MTRAVLLLLLCASAPALAQNCKPFVPKLHVSVVDEQGRPVPGALVDVAGPRGVTDENGNLEFCRPQGNLDFATVTATGYIPLSFDAYKLTYPAFKPRLVRSAGWIRAGHIMVLVLDPTYAGIPGATVELRSQSKTIATSRSGTNAIAYFSVPLPQESRIAVSAPAFEHVEVPLRSQALSVLLDIGSCGPCVDVTPNYPDPHPEPVVLDDLLPVPYPDLEPPVTHSSYRVRRRHRPT